MEKMAPNNSTGRDGKDIIIDVPPAVPLQEMRKVEIWSRNLQKMGKRLFGFRVVKADWEILILKQQPTRHPSMQQPGLPGKEGWKILELKVLPMWDWLVFPMPVNPLLSVITAAKPKIANYAFTNYYAQFGNGGLSWWEKFCIADLPGIIEGAAEGKGLGHRFLRHIEKKFIVAFFLIPADSHSHKKNLIYW